MKDLENIKIATIIPTFNRKHLLLDCLKAISNQILKPKCIYIVDNHSDDNTYEYLVENSCNEWINGIKINYEYLDVNGGGAMGFSLGMLKAYEEDDYDAFWMLDDDGIPENTCLMELAKYIHEYDYLSPILMNINNREQLNVPCNDSYDPLILKEKYGGCNLLKGYCNPFNGGLFSHKAVEIVGFPKSELFIYGDEQNYHQRMIESGITPYGVFSARHHHPILNTTDVQLFMKCVNFRPVKWKQYCIWRNSIYNKKIRKEKLISSLKIIYYYIAHMLFFIVKYPSLEWVYLFNKAFWDGLTEKWGEHYKYL